MSMFNVEGRLLHIYENPGRVDKETGEADEDRPRIQVLGRIPLRNGQHNFGLVDLTCPSPSQYQALLGRDVVVPLGMFSPEKNRIIYFIPQGSHPRLLESVTAAG